MSRAAATLVAAALLGAVATGGCGVGPGEAAEGEASLTVTRDYGAEVLATATLADPTPSDTVVRFLDANAEIETDYGGNFVSTIDGLEGSTVSGGPQDWFFFINGIYSEVGAGETPVRVGDRVWWDYRRWSEAYRVPAVVGSWPEPFLHGYDGEGRVVVVQCVGGEGVGGPCFEVVRALREAGVEPEVEEELARPVETPEELRILVGAWDDLSSDRAAGQLAEGGPSRSGVFAQIHPCRSEPAEIALSLLDAEGRVREELTGWGLIAAVREGEDEPTWVVTAADVPDLGRVAGAVDEESLRDRYALALAADGTARPVPASSDETAPPETDGCR